METVYHFLDKVVLLLVVADTKRGLHELHVN